MSVDIGVDAFTPTQYRRTISIALHCFPSHLQQHEPSERAILELEVNCGEVLRSLERSAQPRTQSVEPGTQSVELGTQPVEPRTQPVEPGTQPAERSQHQEVPV